MKFKYILAIIVIALSGCSSIYHNTNSKTHFSDKAIVLLEAKGNKLTGKVGLRVRKVDGEIPDQSFSSSRVEFKPGNYQVEFSSYWTRGWMGVMPIGIDIAKTAHTLYSDEINRTSSNPKIFDLNLKGGHVYLVSFSYDEKNEIVIHIEEA